MARVLENYTLYSSQYLRHTFLKKTIRLPKNANIMDLGQVFRHIFSRIFIEFSSFAWGVVINIREIL